MQKYGKILLWLTAPVLLYVLYHQVVPRLDWSVWVASLQTAWTSGSWVYLLGAVLLMPINWLLETAKWRTLLSSAIALSFPAALRAVLRGVTVSLFTPNRIGEYGGRILAARAGEHWSYIAATLWGSLAQWIVLLVAGWPALLWVTAPWLRWTGWQYGVAATTGVVLVGAVAGGYYFPDPIVRRLAGLKAYTERLWCRLTGKNLVLPLSAMPGRPDRGSRSRALGLAALRYGVFATQYLLLLYFFGLSVSPLSALPGIAAIFLAQAGLPMPPGIALLVRSELALLVWPAAIPAVPVAATLALFILNLAIPALLGVVFIVTIGDAKSLSYVQPHET